MEKVGRPLNSSRMNGTESAVPDFSESLIIVFCVRFFKNFVSFSCYAVCAHCM